MSLDIWLTAHDTDGNAINVFDLNVTHNLTEMASEAGIYTAMWRPDDQGWTKAGQLIDPLQRGLYLLRKDPQLFTKLNPENGWGSYDGLLNDVTEYLAACRKYPSATVGISR